MNREILFRFWDKALERYSEIPNEYKIGDINLYTDYEIEQYTGLTDKNGTKIFEGDILKTANSQFLILWDERDACFKKYTIDKFNRTLATKLNDSYKNRTLSEINTLIQKDMQIAFEIIGNIHDENN